MTIDDIESTERTLGGLLSLGTRLSTLTLGGGLLFAIAGGGTAASWLLHAGLIVLLATPVARVAVSLLTFVVQRDWRFVLFTGIVLLLLLSGIFAAADA